MSFVRTRTIKGKQYLYEETRWREGGKVRSRSVSLGPVHSDAPGGWLRRQLGRSYGVDWDKIAKEEIARQDVEKGKLAAHIDRLHAEFGLTMGPATPVPIDKPAPVVDLSTPEAAPSADENASPEGEADVSGTPGL
jgi:hypothetical protein